MESLYAFGLGALVFDIFTTLPALTGFCSKILVNLFQLSHNAEQRVVSCAECFEPFESPSQSMALVFDHVGHWRNCIAEHRLLGLASMDFVFANIISPMLFLGVCAGDSR